MTNMRLIRYLFFTFVVAAVVVVASGAFISYKQRNEFEGIIGFNISGNIDYEVVENDIGPMGGVKTIFARIGDFEDALKKCSTSGRYVLGRVNYRKYFVFTDEFERRGMGRSEACLMEVKSQTRELLVVVDSDYIFVFEKQL